MKGIVKGMVIGAVLPSLFAYAAHQETRAFRAAAAVEVLAIDELADHVHGMESSMKTYVQSTKVWAGGGDYVVVQPALQRRARAFTQHRDALYDALEQRTKELETLVGRTYTNQLVEKVQELKRLQGE